MANDSSGSNENQSAGESSGTIVGIAIIWNIGVSFSIKIHGGYTFSSPESVAEGGARIDIEAGIKRKGVKQAFYEFMVSGFAGLNIDDNPGSYIFSDNKLNFAGSGIGEGSGAGINYSYLFSSKLKGSDINQGYGTLYGRFSSDNQTILASTGNDLFVTFYQDYNKDELLSASGYLAYSQFDINSSNYAMKSMSFEIFSPPRIRDESGDPKEYSIGDPLGVGSEAFAYQIDLESHMVFYQSAETRINSNGRFSNSNEITFSERIQVFWQNHVAHGDGYKIPIFDQSILK